MTVDERCAVYPIGTTVGASTRGALAPPPIGHLRLSLTFRKGKAAAHESLAAQAGRQAKERWSGPMRLPTSYSLPAAPASPASPVPVQACPPLPLRGVARLDAAAAAAAATAAAAAVAADAAAVDAAKLTTAGDVNADADESVWVRLASARADAYAAAAAATAAATTGTAAAAAATEEEGGGAEQELGLPHLQQAARKAAPPSPPSPGRHTSPRRNSRAAPSGGSVPPVSPAVFRALTPVDWDPCPSHEAEQAHSHAAVAHALLATTPPDSPRLGSKLSG